MTHVGHLSCVWDHAHWIPGKILPQFDPSHLSVAYQEAKLEIVGKFRTGTGRQNGYYTANFTSKGLRKILKAFLYTNMTLTKTPIPSELTNLAISFGADRLGYGLGPKIAIF